jgi:4-hydroxybenzoate polyprenyltransferase
MPRTEHAAGSGARVRTVALVRCCSIRFTAYYWVGWAAGLAAVGRLDTASALLGVPLWIAYCLGTESINRIADREADVVNRPERTRLCAQAGWRTLLVVAWASWSCFAAIGGGLLWAQPSPALALVLVVDAGVAVGYSIGPQFKRHRVLAPVVLTAPLITPLFTGWAVDPDFGDLRSPVLPAAAVLAAFSLGLSGIKDITDVAGDRRIGYSSLWIALIRLRRGAAVYGLLGAPFLLLTAFVATGALPAVAAAMLPALVLSVLVVTAASRAVDGPDREAAREVMHQYTFYFLALVLLTAVPSTATGVGVSVAVGYWLAASATLHWSGGLTADRLRRWTALFIAPSHKEFS